MPTHSLSTAAAPGRSKTPRALPARDYLKILVRSLAIVLVIALMMSGPRVFTAGYWSMGSLEPHWPDWRPLSSASLAIKIHLATVLAAALIGLFLMINRKGGRLHRRLGYIYMGAMFLTGLVTLTIPRPPIGPHLGPFGPLHLFSLTALIGVPVALWAARTGRWLVHGRLMGGLFVGGIGIAGLGAFMPGRLMWSLFFG